jgi:hypothetical protein
MVISEPLVAVSEAEGDAEPANLQEAKTADAPCRNVEDLHVETLSRHAERPADG